MPELPSYRNQSIDLHIKSIDWFLYEGNTKPNSYMKVDAIKEIRTFLLVLSWFELFQWNLKIEKKVAGREISGPLRLFPSVIIYFLTYCNI